jgi:hypothetical protein
VGQRGHSQSKGLCVHFSMKKLLLYRVLVGKPEGKRPLGRPLRRGEVNLKMGLHEVGWGTRTRLSWHL